jgi:hypothetical protein
MMKTLINRRIVKFFSWARLLDPIQFESLIADDILKPKKTTPIPDSKQRRDSTDKMQPKNYEDEQEEDFEEGVSDISNLFYRIKECDLNLEGTHDVILELNQIAPPYKLEEHFKLYLNFIQIVWEKLRLIKRDNFQEIIKSGSKFKSAFPALKDEKLLLITQISFQLLRNISTVVNYNKVRVTKIIEKVRSLCCFFIEFNFKVLTMDQKVELFSFLSKTQDPSVKYYFIFLTNIKNIIQDLNFNHVQSILRNMTPSTYGFLFKKDQAYQVIQNFKVDNHKIFTSLISSLFTNYIEKMDQSFNPNAFPFVMSNVYKTE